MIHILRHWTGMDGEEIYDLLSGLFPLLLGFGIWGSWLKKHNCHEPGCWRMIWHVDPRHGHPVCKVHHMDHPKGGSNDEPILR